MCSNQKGCSWFENIWTGLAGKNTHQINYNFFLNFNPKTQRSLDNFPPLTGDFGCRASIAGVIGTTGFLVPESSLIPFSQDSWIHLVAMPPSSPSTRTTPSLKGKCSSLRTVTQPLRRDDSRLNISNRRIPRHK